MALTLAEELTLLAYDDDTGKSKADVFFEYGLGGALLAELAVLEKVTLSGKKVSVVDATPTGDPQLDAALAAIADSPPRSPKRWVERLRKGTKPAMLQRLVDRGLLRRHEGKVLLVFPMTTYPTRDGRPEQEIRQRLRDALVAGNVPELRTVTLALLVGACDLGKVVFPDLPKKEVKRKLNELTAGDWAAKATKEAIEAVRAAVLASTTAAATTSAAAGGST